MTAAIPYKCQTFFCDTGDAAWNDPKSLQEGDSPDEEALHDIKS